MSLKEQGCNTSRVQDSDKLGLLAIRAGEIMLRSGAEIYRVEDAVTAICKARNIPYVECFATTTGIFLSFGDSAPGGQLESIIKRVPAISTDLEKVSLVNDLVRKFSGSEMSVAEGLTALDSVDATRHFSLAVRLIAAALLAAFFALMNSGGFVDGALSLGIGVLTYLLSLGIERLHINRFIVIFVSCAFCAALSLVAFNLGLGGSLAAIIIGGITVFLPGVAITNAVRDLLAGDMLAGTARVSEALLITVAIAAGVGILLHLAPAATRMDVTVWLPIPLQFVFAIVGTLGVSIIVNIPRRYLLPTSLIAACGWAIFYSFIFYGNSRLFGCFLGACLVALLAEVCARLSKEAATLFIIPAIFPLVPGIGMYNTMLQLIEGNYDLAVRIGAEALFMAGGIALALLVIISLARIARAVVRWINDSLRMRM
ncbi:MAG: threonine/serine exporter family protein [Coriobacteriales bacterium]|jgi:uncharacterized membrane protein YjjP (DUF1212 family)|nr:threonine/serine exporter family protein [Coriobacteriales bacterium]